MQGDCPVSDSAAIDLGTNTARLLIGSGRSDGIEQNYILRRITRLGGGFSAETGISPEARSRTLMAMKEFSVKISEYNVAQIRAVATSAVRDAVNRDDFCREIFEETGIRLEVIDGETEALMTLKGVLAALDEVPEKLLVFDIGGGSTEFTVAESGKHKFSASLPLGVVRLTEGKSDISAMNEKIDRELAQLVLKMKLKGLLPFDPETVAVGTAGTATTLAAISMEMTDYDYRKVNNYSLSLDKIESIYRRLSPLSSEDRLKIPGMEKGREDLIIAGTLLTIKTLACFNRKFLKVSDFGLLEGVMLSIPLKTC
jgi:exopolyphosphatase/guanosine-5'-triphosphate,3'-diphosphate pyrophosphatase